MICTQIGRIVAGSGNGKGALGDGTANRIAFGRV